MKQRQWYINEAELDDFQLRIVRRNFKNPIILNGLNGDSFILALWKFKELLERGIANMVFYVSNNDELKKFEKGFREIGIPLNYLQVFIETFKIEHEFIFLLNVNISDKYLKYLKITNKQIFAFFIKDYCEEFTISPNYMAEQLGIPIEKFVFNNRTPKQHFELFQILFEIEDSEKDRCIKTKGEFQIKYFKSIEKEFGWVNSISEQIGFENVLVVVRDEIFKQVFKGFSIDVDVKTYNEISFLDLYQVVFLINYNLEQQPEKLLLKRALKASNKDIILSTTYYQEKLITS